MKSIFLFVSILVISYCESWSPVGNRLKSKWTTQVNPAKPWPEYPRPHLERKNWFNLNGLWEYSITPIEANQPNKYDGEILVPFPVESSLSGVQKAINEHQTLWYKRNFTTDVGPDEILILHFDAVDYHSIVYINEHPVGEHKGGYNRFSFDITKFVNGNKENTLVVKITDATGGSQPIGKQRLHSEGIWFTCTTGIWQTVWLEKVPKSYIMGLRITPDIDSNSVEITVNTKGPLDHSYIRILDSVGKVVASNENASINSPNKIKIPSPRLWSTSDPYLYSIQVNAGEDSVTSYVGMRKMEVKKDSKGINRFFLNHKPIFMFGPLDQGYWPDGVYTPPNEEAMIYDLKMTHEFGFNTVRKHVKVESDRWYYATDKMGLLVWQDFPSAFGGVKENKRTADDSKQIELEMKRMVQQLHNFPSIIMWVPFNEGWGQYDTGRVVELFREWDPSRLINEASGWDDHHVSNIEDHHSYPSAVEIKINPNRVIVNGEFGGGSLVIKGHAWNESKHSRFTDSQQLDKFFIDRLATVRAHAIYGLGAAIYTETTDVETESVGLLTYDRAVVKVSSALTLREQIDKLYPSQSVANVILPSGHQSNNQEWHYTDKYPDGNWTHMSYDSKNWSIGKAGFGAGKVPEITINTEWKAPDIWLRKEFEIPNGKLPKHPVLYIFYDDIANVYINGIEVDKGEFNPRQLGYAAHDLDSKLLKEGNNLIAIHCHQIDGGQGIDAGIIDITYEN